MARPLTLPNKHKKERIKRLCLKCDRLRWMSKEHHLCDRCNKENRGMGQVGRYGTTLNGVRR